LCVLRHNISPFGHRHVLSSGNRSFMRAQIAAGLLASLLPVVSPAQSVEQVFTSAWTVLPWDYYGDVAAMQWHYLPYRPWDASLGRLDRVTVSTVVTGTRMNSADDVRLRYSFFTGWMPADYQFYDEVVLPSGSLSFNFTRDFVFVTPSSLVTWTTYDYLPRANYYFESRTVAGGHSLTATTTLTYAYSAVVPEPNTTILFTSGGLVVGLGAAYRRRRRATTA
jgi:hypothetical protein